MGSSSGLRERLRAGMGLGRGVLSSVFGHLVHICWRAALVQCGVVGASQAWAQRRRLLAVKMLGCPATSLHAAYDFNHGCGGQFHKLRVSYLKRHCLSIFCPRAVNMLQLKPEGKGTNIPWGNPQPLVGRGGDTLERHLLPLLQWTVLPHSPRSKTSIKHLYTSFSSSLPLTPASRSHSQDPYLRLCFQANTRQEESEKAPPRRQGSICALLQDRLGHRDIRNHSNLRAIDLLCVEGFWKHKAQLFSKASPFLN